MLFDGTKINIFIAFLSGIITFFASCLLPLVPTYLAYLSGNFKGGKRGVLVNSLFFTFGFTLVFILLGIITNYFGSFLAQNKVFINKLGGVFLIVGSLPRIFLPLTTSLRTIEKLSISTGKHINHVLCGITLCR